MKKVTNILLLLLSISFLAASCVEPDDEITEMPQGLITSQAADDMEELYVANQYAVLNKALAEAGDNEPDSRETWFSIEEMERYIAYVKRASDSLGYKNLGIRIYNAGKKERNGKIYTTVFLTPTHRDEKKVGIESFFVNSANAQPTAVSANQNSTTLYSLDYGEFGKPPKVYSLH